jgi:hypothetical protein
MAGVVVVMPILAALPAPDWNKTELMTDDVPLNIDR